MRCFSLIANEPAYCAEDTRYYQHMKVRKTQNTQCDAMAFQISSLTIVYSTVYSGADQRKHQSSASLASGWPVKSPHKWPVTRKCFHLMTSSCINIFSGGLRSRSPLVILMPWHYIPWICYERSFSEFYLSIWNQLVVNQRLKLFVQSPQPYLLIFAWRN